MRYTLLVVLSLCLASAAAANPQLPSERATAAATAGLSAPVYVITGGGYGHGVGLSQYGALGQARANRTYQDILSFYYPGTSFAKAPITKVRVLVAAASPAAKIASAVPFTVRDGSGATMALPAGELVLKPDLSIVRDGTATVLPAPLTFVPGKGSTLSLGGKGYRGELVAEVVKGSLQIIDVVGLDAYLLGVVPGEMPKEWPAAALQAQAVASRSYALASLVKNRPFDLYADPRSQVYYGVGAESPATTAAVKATRSEILTYAGKVATTFYYSSSGGRTASSEDVFGLVMPYLQARDDPWDLLSPYHRWLPKAYTPASLGQAFGLSAPVVDVEIVPTPSGRPASVTLVKKSGVRVLLRAADVRARLGLRSTAFRIGILRVGRPTGVAASGSAVTVAGLARDVEAPQLEKLGANGTWLPSVKILAADDGSFEVTLHPRATATYRLTAEGQIGPALTVTVTPVPA